MWLKNRSGVGACGLLDFQDAVRGPIAYDLVSLFEDARRDVPADLAAKFLQYYCDANPKLDKGRFFASYAVLGAQRSTKILGIFTRLARRDGKPHYLHHISRVWRWLRAHIRGADPREPHRSRLHAPPTARRPNGLCARGPAPGAVGADSC